MNCIGDMYTCNKTYIVKNGTTVRETVHFIETELMVVKIAINFILERKC